MKGLHVPGIVVGLSACLLAGCKADGYWKPSTSLPPGFAADNPCAGVAHQASPPLRNVVASDRDGWVAMKYHVASNGDVFNVRVIAANPEGVFDEAAAAALERRQFPAVVYPLRNCSHVVVYRRSEDYADARRHSSP